MRGCCEKRGASRLRRKLIAGLLLSVAGQMPPEDIIASCAQKIKRETGRRDYDLLYIERGTCSVGNSQRGDARGGWSVDNLLLQDTSLRSQL